jgi:hypothetical protein
MKQVRILATTIATSMLFSFCSCNSGEEKKADETTSTATTTAEKVPEITAPAKPSNVMIMQFKVADFEKWKAKYDERDSIRRSYGLTNYVVGRGLDDPSMVVVFLKMQDANKAKELTSSQGMKDRMKIAGVTGTPTFHYLDVVMDDNSVIPQTDRILVTEKIKDWDVWKKSFDDHKQMRIDSAGLIDRGLGYEVGDNHSVTVVFAITDMKKARAFIQSKQLKDIMEKAGVEGKPVHFFYGIVQTYP